MAFQSDLYRQQQVEPHWYALHTRHHHEKRVEARLREKRIVSYLPLHTVYRQWSDRCKKVAEPLFSCYVFVRIALRECLAVLQTEGAVNLVSFNGTPAVIPADQIEAIQRVLVQNLEVVRADYYAPGERVRVVKGPLQNVEGTLLIQKSNQRLIVRVEGIRQAIAFEINPQHVERIGAGCVAY